LTGKTDPSPRQIVDDPSATSATTLQAPSISAPPPEPSAARMSDPPTVDMSPSIGPTARLEAPALACDACKKANHVGVPACVFCGHPFASAPLIAAKSGWASSGTGAVASIEHDEDEAPPSRRQRTSLDELVPAPIADPLIGVIVAERYRILDAIGRGGMGIVYKVEHTRIGKLLAMKLLTGELSRNPDVVRRFKQEALTASKLSSPNTVQVFDFGAAEGLTYLVMELVAGEDLGRVLRSTGPMPFNRLGKIIVQACSSLVEAHQKGIVHRDIKPENIMLLRAPRDGTDIAKVLDFGLAKLREGADLNDVTSQGAIVGTPYFMSPEQVRGEAVDARTDIYALGALMYRALTGFYPFMGPTPMAVFTKHLTEEPVPPHERAKELGIAPQISEIVLKALAKDPSARWQKVEELQAALLDELRATSTSSVETLLDSGQLRKLSKVAADTEIKTMMGLTANAGDIATRDELEGYERKLRRLRYTAIGSGLLLVAVAVAALSRVVAWQQHPAFEGVEIEPNDSAAEAQVVPFGAEVKGYLGKRIDPQHGDRDFFAIDVPADGARAQTAVKLRVSALPNFATCTFLYKRGFSQAVGQYCVGLPGRDLEVRALALEPGRYLVAVMQDLDGYGGLPPPVFENVSDAYALELSRAEADPSFEIEPNDQPSAATPVVPGAPMHGTISWARDEDVYCVPDSVRGAVAFRVTDANTRPAFEVLEASRLSGGDEVERVRVHVTSGRPTSTDAKSPWTSDLVADDGAPRCVRLRLASNPWSDERTVPRGSGDVYTIDVVTE
jgi:serine/threonine-protein kinase